MTEPVIIKSRGVPFGGTPVTPEVDKLLEAFGTHPPAGVITWGQLEGTLGMPRGSADTAQGRRFRSILQAWRKRLYDEHQIDTAGEANIGVRVLHGDGHVVEVERRVKLAAKQLVRQGDRVTVIDTSALSTAAQRQADNLRIVAAQMQAAAERGRKALRAGKKKDK
jgi:hypothetical protein